MTAHAMQHNRVAPALPPMRLATGTRLSAQDIYPRLFDAILEQRIVPASRFTEDSLAQSFGASRSVIRRVLARLAEQQVIILRPNLRAQVAQPDARQVQHILEARRLMEVTVVKLACAKATPAQVRLLRELIAQQRACSEQGQRGAAIRLWGDFHLQLATIAGNRPLAQFLNSLVPLTSLILAQHGLGANGNLIGPEHEEIVQALERCDVNRSATLMIRHLEHIGLQLSLCTAQ
ncbi:GntR family transcriptional regulator [Pseudomonas orientalis]|uniref:DNA-binding transcriptional regulator, GntR family n=1 Tax=Pseudomonas orientalis TaxID=76758 RepID=A0A1H2EHL8_9PSED|nr:GntR family transcriptional regulator [Pseudomonas orientalis]KRP63504.1 GntR family transcriptional regulator [Pseudomonas orientalis]SDT94499.1 DNA-binding transcriptional regulator, GntR family [Pseudomonas orientalis]